LGDKLPIACLQYPLQTSGIRQFKQGSADNPQRPVGFLLSRRWIKPNPDYQ
jgi:hypothetical protein